MRGIYSPSTSDRDVLAATPTGVFFGSRSERVHSNMKHKKQGVVDDIGRQGNKYVHLLDKKG